MDLKKRALKFLFSRFFILGLLFIAQAALLIWIVLRARAYGHIVAEVFYVVSIIMAIWVLSRDMHPTYKLAWIVPILIAPLFGGLFYLLFGTHGFRRDKLIDKFAPYLGTDTSPQNTEVLEKLLLLDQDAGLQAYFMERVSGSPVYDRTETRYFPSGELFFEQLKEDLMHARRYIFLEFFIIEEGVMLDEILEILEFKAGQGVDIRLLYDDVGSAARVSSSFPARLRERGIKCQVFNARGLKLSFILNNRDHRKIAVIDGLISYTGGLNLADEYINKIQPFGHWKDVAVRLKGEATWSFVLIFLQMWCFADKSAPKSLDEYRADPAELTRISSDGYVLPYADSSPITRIPVSKHAFLNAIQDAERSIYIATPYLIIDAEMQTALCLSALMGLDVRIVTPAIPDKKLVFEVTRANYLELLRAGVKIYEYTPGFIHAKTMIVDGESAVVGTCNFDFRSFFLHFECGTFMYGSRAVYELLQDFMHTVSISKEITLEDQLAVSVPRKILRRILLAFAPLL